MIELLLSPKKARREPWQLLFLSAFFVSLAVVVNLAVPSIEGGVITFAMIPSIPLIWHLLLREEKEEEKKLELLKQNQFAFAYHLPLIEVFAFFFIGSAFAYCIWYVILATAAPETASSLFEAQLNEIKAIGATVSTIGGSLFRPDFALNLLEHNLTVLAFMFVFTLVYGIGSVYLLLWNASIIGVFVGTKLATTGLNGFLQAVIAIIPHGSLEIGAYFLASIAGGIISAALMREHHKREEFKLIVRDALLLTVISVVALAIAAVFESSG